MAQHTSIQLRETILQLCKQGKSSQTIALIVGIGISTMNNFLTKYGSGYGLKYEHWSGRPRKTTVWVNKIIKRKSTVDPRKTASDIARELKEENHVTVSWRTVSRHLNDVDLIGCVAIKNPYISKKNQKARLDFAKQNREWTSENWKRVAFSDELKFNLFGSDGRWYIRHPVGSWYDSRNQIPTVKHDGGSVLVWGVFSANELGSLVLIEGTMNGPKYKEILKNNLLPYSNSFMAEEWIFQHDNDPKHTSKVVKDWLASNRIEEASSITGP